MKNVLATGVVLAPIALTLAAITACAAPTDGEESSMSRNEALVGPGIWQLNRECGTAETGACSKDIATCGAASTIGGACIDAGTRCLSAPNASGLRHVLFCNPTSNSTWTFNGDCGGDCGSRPACKDDDKPGERCHYPLSRCAKNDRVFVCLTNGKDQYVFNGYCGKNGGPACAGIAACPTDDDGMAGLACDVVGTTCKRKIDELTGKLFTCVSR